MINEEDRKWLYERMQKAGVDTGSYEDFTSSLNNSKEDRDWYYEKSKSLGLDVGSADDFYSMMVDASQTQPTTQPAQPETQQPSNVFTAEELAAQEAEATPIQQEAIMEGANMGGNLLKAVEQSSGASQTPTTAEQTQEQPVQEQQTAQQEAPQETPQDVEQPATETGTAQQEEQTSQEAQAPQEDSNKLTYSEEERLGLARTLASARNTAASVGRMQQNRDYYDKNVSTAGRITMGLGQENPSVIGGSPRVVAKSEITEDGQKTVYINETGMEYDSQEAAAADQNIIDQIHRATYNGYIPDLPIDADATPEERGKQLDEAIVENERKMRELDEKEKDKKTNITMPTGFSGGGVVFQPGSLSTQEVSDERKKLMAEHDMLEQARRTNAVLRDLRKSDGFFDLNNITNFVRGLKDETTDIRLGGLVDMMTATALKDLSDKIKRGEKLNDTEMSLLAAAGANAQIQQAAEGNIPHGYSAGRTTAAMAPFMAQMALIPGGGFGGLFGRQAILKFGKQGLKSFVTRAAAKISGDILTSTLLANTVQAPAVYADAINRMVGDVVVDGNGKVSFIGGESAVEAFTDAALAMGIENYTEMALEGNGKIGRILLDKMAGKLNLPAVRRMLTRMDRSSMLRGVRQFEERTKWGGNIGEVIEEELGIVLNSIFVGDNEISDLANLDQQIDILLGVGAFGGAMSTVNTGLYAYGQHKLSKAAEASSAKAAISFGDQWEDIRSQIDNAEDDNTLRSLLVGIVSDQSLNNAQRRAVLDYAVRRSAYQGYNFGMQINRDEMGPASRAGYDAFSIGYEMQGEDINNVGSMNREAMAFLMGSEEGKKIVDDIRNMTQRGASQEEVDAYFGQLEGMTRNAALDYYSTRMMIQGAGARMQADTEKGIAQYEADVDEGTANVGGQPVVITATVDGGQVYVLDNNGSTAVIMEFGRKRQVPSSKIENPTAHNPETYKAQYADAARKSVEDELNFRINHHAKTVQPVVGTELREHAEDGSTASFVVTSVDPNTGMVGYVPMVFDATEGREVPKNGADVQQMSIDDALAVQDKWWEEQDLQQNQAAETSEEAPVVEEETEQPLVQPGIIEGSETAEQPQPEVIPQEAVTRQPAQPQAQQQPANNRTYEPEEIITLHEEGGDIEATVMGMAEDGKYSVMVNRGGRTVAEHYTKQELDALTAEPQNTEPQPIGKGVFGNIYDQFKGKAREAIYFLMKKKSGEAIGALHHKEIGDIDLVWGEEGTNKSDGYGLAKLVKYHPEVLDNLQEILDDMHVTVRSENRIQLESETHQASVRLTWDNQKKTWLLTAFEKKNSALDNTTDTGETSVGGRQNDTATLRNTVSESKDTENVSNGQEIAGENAGTAAEQRRMAGARISEEARQKFPKIAERWEKAPKVQGRRSVYSMPDGTVITGQYVLTEDGAFTPSHDPHTFKPNEGFPTTEQGTTANSRDYEHGAEAQATVISNGQSYNGNALQDAIVVSQDGIVYSGNNRTMSGQLAAENGTDGTYRRVLEARAEEFGFTPEDIAGMQHPRVVFVADEGQGLDYTPATFDRFNTQREKGESAVEQSVRFGKTMDGNTFSRLGEVIGRRKKLQDMYKSAEDCKEIVDILQNAGFITQGNRVSFIDNDGLLTARGREMLESALTGYVLRDNEQAVRLLSGMPSVRKVFVEALNEIAANGNLGEEYSLSNELSDAISMLHQVKASGMTLEDFYVQGDFTQNVQELYNATTYMLAQLLDEKKSKSLKDVLRSYNEEALQQTQGGALFGRREEEEILRDILNALGYETRQRANNTQPAAEASGLGQTSQQTDTAPQGNDEVTSEPGDAFADAQQILAKERERREREQREKDEQEKPKSEAQYGTANTLVSKDRYEELRKRMRDKLRGQMNAGFDPEILTIGTEMAMYHIEAGARKFADFARKMIEDLGDAIRPYLKAIYNGAREMPGMEELNKEMSSYEEVSSSDVNSIRQNAENTEEKNAETEEETNNTVNLQGDSAEFAEKQFKLEQLSKKIHAKLQGIVNWGDQPKPLSAYKQIANELGIKNLSDTDLQELIETEVVNLAREIANKEGLTEEKKFQKIVKLYEGQPSLNTRDNDRINLQQYSTPAPMAFVMGRFLIADKPLTGQGLEPSAGNGMLTIALPKERMHVNDIDEMRLSNLAKQGFGVVTSQDGTQPFSPKAYQVVVTNPPFGNTAAKNYDGYEISGLEHQMAINALDSMEDDGRAAIIIGGNTEYNPNGSIKGKDKMFLNYLYSHYNVVDVINMDGKSLYSRQGTGYPVRMILINGRKQADGSFAPVQSKARAEQVKTYEELYKRVNDDILRNKEQHGNTPDGVHPAAQESDGRTSDNRNAGTSNEEGIRGVRSGNSSGEHLLPTEPNSGVQRSDSSTEAEGGRGNAQSAEDGGMGTRTAVLDGSRNQTEQSSRSEVVPSRDRRGEVADRGSNSQQLSGESLDSRTGLPVEEQHRELGAEKVPYRKQSKNPFDLQSQMPAEQAEVVKKALEDLGDVDQYLVEELGYSSIEDLHHGSQSPDNHGGLAAEQIDSVAMAIHQMKKGDAFIIGDQTGIGKGRQGAALIRWAVKQGMSPVYFTAKPELFSGVHRDLKDIGSGELRPFILASDKTKARIVENKDGQQSVVYDLPTDKEQKRVLNYIAEYGKLPPEYDYMITTYSQVGNGTMSYENGAKKARSFGKGKSAKPADINGQAKRDAIEVLSSNSIVLMDESHLAGGDSARGNYLQFISTRARGITYISATFAKRPDNMPLYSLRTAISKAGVAINDLIDAVKRGGATFQEIMSKALTEAGQMIRRERNMAGVTVDWRGIEDESVIQKHYKQYDKIIGLFNDIIDFQRTYVDPIVNGMNDAAAEMQGSVDHTPGTRDMGINNTPFASRTHLIVKQVLLSLKAEEGAKFAIECLKRGEKPVICLENTNEGAADRATNPADEEMVMPDLSVNLKQGLKGTLRITEKDAFGNAINSEIPFSRLSEEGRTRYGEIMDAIDNASSGLSLSPIDVIKNEIRKAGYSVAELTGRKKEFVYNDNGTVKRVNRTDTDNKKNANDFNNGKIDAVIINKSAGTGIDLHAGMKFNNTDQRHMVVVQAQSDINDEVQMRGRTDRTGQKQHSKYTYIVSTIPSEQRLLMMLKAKLRSLDANTTSSQKSKFNEMQVRDILNKYGDEIVIQYLAENPDVAIKLVDPLKWGDTIYDTSVESLVETAQRVPGDGETAKKVLGRMALLTVREQEKMLDDISQLYDAEITRLNEMGENDLEITEMPLRAKTLKKDVWEQGVEPGGKNPFADNTYVEKVSMDILVKPMKASEVKGAQNSLLGGKSWEEYKDGVLKNVSEWAEKKKADTREATTARAEKKANAEKEKYIKTAKKNQAKNGMTDEEIAHNGDLQYDLFYNQEMEKLDFALSVIDRQREAFERIFETFSPDGVYAIPTDIYNLGLTFSPSFAKLIDIKIASNFSTTASTISFAVLDGRRKITFPISGLLKQVGGGKQDIIQSIFMLTSQAKGNMFGQNVVNTMRVLEMNLDNWDRLLPSNTRKEGYIITGNLLKALASTKEQHLGGKLISYTTDTGEVRQGILMSDQFKPEGLTSKTPISAKADELRYKGDKIVSADGDISIRVTNDYDWRNGGYNRMELSVPKSAKKGEKFFNDEELLSLVYGHQFEGSSKLRAEFSRDSLPAVLKRLDQLGVTVQEEVNTDTNENAAKGVRFRTSSELDEQYPTWLSGQTTDTGQHTTQITSTVKSYRRIGAWMALNDMGNAEVLDASSGLGTGTQALREMGFKVDDVEPYPSENREAPTYLRYEDINKKYDVIISNAVLNVIPDDWRADVLKSMADKLKVGGKLIINVRDAASIASQKQKIELDSPSEILVTDSKGNIRAYQKGFTKPELKSYVEQQLGKGWQVDIATEANSGLKSGVAVVVTKTADAEGLRYRLPGRKDTKRAPETAPLIPKEGSPADISSADVAKVQQKLDTLAQNLEKISGGRKNFLKEVADALGAKQQGSKSRYITFEARNGDIVTLRLADHNAKVSTFDNNGEKNGISIVVSKRSNSGMENDGEAHVVEFFYPEIAVRKAGGKSLADIVRSIEQALYSGEYNDTTGLAEREEVNIEDVRARFGEEVEGTPMQSPKVAGYTARQREAYDARRPRRVKAAINEMTEKLQVSDRVTVIDSYDNAPEDIKKILRSRPRAKGWFDPKTGKIVVVAYNHANEWDARVTVLHEAVAHYGLRELFGEHFDQFLTNVYEGAAPEVRSRINSLMEQNGWDYLEATEEYLAGLAEDTNFEHMPVGFWSQIRAWFLDMLRKIGLSNFDVDDITDNELRYLLWRSYKNLTTRRAGERSIYDHAEDVAMQSRLGLTEEREEDDIFSNYKVAEAPGIDMSEVASIKAEPENDGFATGVGVYLTMKDGQEYHLWIDTDDVNDESYGTVEFYGNTDEDIPDEEMTARFGKFFGEHVNTIFGEDIGSLLLAKRTQNNGIVLREDDFKAMGVADERPIRFRDYSPRDKEIARGFYERAMSSSGVQVREALQDNMVSLEKVYQAVLGKDTHIEDVPSWKNAYTSANSLTSRGRVEQVDFARLYMTPLLDAISKLTKGERNAREELTDYMMAKHGLERNRVFAERDARRQVIAELGERPDDTVNPAGAMAWDQKVADYTIQNREKDYSGLTALTEESDVAFAEDIARQMVDDYENTHDMADIDELWQCTKAFTDALLEKQRVGGLRTQEQTDAVSSMFEYYIPLRGWDEKVAPDVYGYLNSDMNGLQGSVIKSAKGRRSKADDPIAVLALLADQTITQANRNGVKLQFLNFVLDNPSNLVSVNKLWVEKDDVSGEWRAVFCDTINDDDSPEVVAQKVEAFEAQMQAAKAAYPDKYKVGREAASVPYRVIGKDQMNEHQIRVSRNGVTYVLTINGSPRAAQALNGKLNPEVNKGAISSFLDAASRLNRWMAANFTTRNPDFVLGNLARDAFYSNSLVWVKESPRYAVRFHKNFGISLVLAGRLLWKFEHGKLDLSNKTDKMFDEFMRGGGETGFMSMLDIEQHKKEIAKKVKQGKFSNAMEAFFDFLGLGNRWAENASRFAAFMTSRELGRDVQRSVYDAKEITVNFNKKGAQDTMLRKNGQTIAGNVASMIGGFGSTTHVFWNAGVQGLANIYGATSRHPKKAAILFTMGLAAGVLNALLRAQGDDDDDKDKNQGETKPNYFDLPYYVRRSNIVIGGGGSFVSIPLPIEARAWYGLGELAASTLSGKERYTNEELAQQIMGEVSQLFPIDLMEGGADAVHALMPSAFKPWYEVHENESWTGKPIYRDTPWNKRDPEWSKAYKSTSTLFVNTSRLLNEISRKEGKPVGWANFNPAKAEYIARGYFGGVFTFASELEKSAETIFGDREFEWRNTPVANRFVRQVDERTQQSRLKNDYYRYKDMADEMAEWERFWKKPSPEDTEKYASELKALRELDDYKAYQVFKAANKAVTKAKTDEAKEAAMKNVVARMRQFEEELKAEQTEQD